MKELNFVLDLVFRVMPDGIVDYLGGSKHLEPRENLAAQGIPDDRELLVAYMRTFYCVTPTFRTKRQWEKALTLFDKFINDLEDLKP